MSFRGTTIRRKIVALLFIPLVSLMALWGYAAAITTSDVRSVLSVQKTIEHLAHPAESSLRALQKERRQAIVYLADPRQPDARRDLLRRESATDTVITRLRAQAGSADNRGRLSSNSRHWLDTLISRLDGLSSLRGGVENQQVTHLQAYDAYNAVVDPVFDFLDSFSSLNDLELTRPIRALTTIIRATDNISREDALMSGAVAADRTTAPDLEEFTFAVGAQRAYYRDYLKLLQSQERSLYTGFWNGAHGRALRSAENAVIAAGVSGAPRAAGRASWHTAASTALTDLDKIATRSRRIQVARTTQPYADKQFALAGIASGAGLLAVVASLIVSARIGRRLIRDLTWLRREAEDVSGTRLPRVMRRLAAGEEVDIETEAPRLEYGDDEVGQVGRALGALQRSAVEAAVRQSEMRRGVSEVFVNLARRSQVLLHRQLTLLDAMERRTEDPRELADLFRLDHMTTRMRRHAEGLVILSGAAPSRQWRNPVQLMDVVRAAVAEVEDYERVEVRRMTGVAVVGPAVADITHLIAELVENATVFSPPQTMVEVHGQQVAHGFALEIDDRGLGLTQDAMLESNLRVAETPEFELSHTDRLGLFVVSRLAQRRGVGVSLKPSPYGGTTAVVLIPAALLTTGGGTEDTGGSPTGEHRADKAPQPLGEAAKAEHGFRKWGLTDDREGEPRDHREFPAGAGPGARPAVEPPSSGPGVLPRRRRTPVVAVENDRPMTDTSRPGTSGPAPRRAGTPRSGASAPGAPRAEAPASQASGFQASGSQVSRPRVPGAGATGPEPPRATPGGASAQPASPPAGAGGLPRRVRQASLAPQLREDAADETPHSTPPRPGRAERERSPDEVRVRMASLQRGWTRGRSANDPDEAQGSDGLGDSAPRTTTEGNGP